MWNPLAALPASNIGALAAYSPQVMPNPVPVPNTLHPIFGQHDRSNAGGMADPSAFQAAMQGWRGDRPDMARFDPRAAMAGAPAGTPFDPRQARMDWQTNTFDPWRQSMMDWRGDRPLRSDF